jgi:Tol biopolymer transport system component
MLNRTLRLIFGVHVCSVTVLFVLVGSRASLSAAVPCPGECSGDGQVTVTELIVGVNIVLGNAMLAECPVFDTNDDGRVTINELIAAVGAALNGCPGFAAHYVAAVSLAAAHSGMIDLSADAHGQLSGSLIIGGPHSAARFVPAFTFPVDGVSVSLVGSYDPASGGFEVQGSFLDANNETVPVDISGTLPGPTGSAPINVFVGSNPPISTTLSAALPATPTMTPGPTPTPAPVGSQRIVYAGGLLAPDLFVINLDGSGKTQITTSTGIDSKPAWSPDGTEVAFATPDAQNDHIGIAIVRANGSGFRRLAEDTAFLDGSPAWSPNGSQIVFTAGGGDAIDVMNADGSDRHRLLTKSAGETYGHLSWSPDGSRIAFESTRPLQAGDDDRYEIWVMNADGSNLVRLTNNSVADHHPAWSPDGSKIAFGRGGASGGVYTIHPDGSGESRLVSAPYSALLPSWSHDGTQLMYQALFGLTLTNASGGSPTTVPNTAYVSDFDFK